MPKIRCPRYFTAQSTRDCKLTSRALRGTSLLRLDVGVADHLAPFRRVGPDAGREVLRRAGARGDEARSENALAELRGGEDARRLCIQFVHDRARRAGGRKQPVPGAGLVARKAALG